jgi:hypothetical protein
MGGRGRRRIWRVIVVALSIGACVPAEQVDGWPLAARIPCEMTSSDPDARSALQEEIARRLGAVEVVEDQCRYPGPMRVDGQAISWESTPGGIELHALTLSDGTRHVVALSCPARSPLPPGAPPAQGARCLVIQLPD